MKPLQTPSTDARARRIFGLPHLSLLLVAVLLLALGLAGCGGRGADAAAQPPAPAVRVVAAQAGEVTDWDTFTGRFQAVESVNLRPRVSGYIDEVSFAEGRMVKKGDVLFVIDPRPYRVELARVRAELASAEAQLALSEKELARAARLLQQRAISQEEYDRRISGRDRLVAGLQAARAGVEAAQLNLEYTRVVAPIDGLVSSAEVTSGNYVTAGDTILTSVVSLDPIYVHFESDERTYLKYAAQARSGERPGPRDRANPVLIGLATGEEFPFRGEMNFLDNALNPETGTIRVRAVVANPDLAFTPGMLARVKIEGSGRYRATLIPDEAVGTDQGRKYVVVVNADNVAEYRPVTLGGLHEHRRVVRSGIEAGERIVVGGLQRVRPGATVAPETAAGERKVARRDDDASALQL